MLTSGLISGLAAVSAAGLTTVAFAASGPSAATTAFAGSPVGSPAVVAAPIVPDVAAGWAWPVRPPSVVRGFDAVGRYEAGHRGVDLVAAPGQEVVAAAAGSVSFAGQVAGRGIVVVTHADGLRTTYEPVAATVTVGTVVVAGQRLGTLSGPAHCVQDCLHLGLRDGETYLDPLTRLRAAAPVLLPTGRP